MSQPIHQQTPAQTSPPQSAGVLQRKCRTCGQHTLARDLCDNCRQAGSGTASAVSLADTLSIQPVALSAMGRGADLSHIPVSRTTSPVIQAKLTVSQPGDKYEQEADRVAEEVVRRMNNPQSEGLQRQPLPHEEDGQLYRKPAAQSPINFLHPVSAGDGLPVSPSLETVIQHARSSGGQALPEQVREAMEQAVGADFSDVRIHADSQSDNLNKLLNARAFTIGQDIFFLRKEYSLSNNQGLALIAHELIHTRQQQIGNLSENLQSQFLQRFEVRHTPRWGTEPQESNTSAMIFDPWVSLCMEGQCVGENFYRGQNRYDLSISPEHTPCIVSLSINALWKCDNIELEDVPILRRLLTPIVGDLYGEGHASLSTEVRISPQGIVNIERPTLEGPDNSGEGARLVVGEHGIDRDENLLYAEVSIDGSTARTTAREFQFGVQSGFEVSSEGSGVSSGVGASSNLVEGDEVQMVSTWGKTFSVSISAILPENAPETAERTREVQWPNF